MNLLSLEPLPFALALVILVALFAGGGGSRSSALYGLNATVTCLQGKGLPAVKESPGTVPLSEGKPDIYVPYGGEDIYVSFESSADEARATKEAIDDASYLFAFTNVTTTNGNAMIYTRAGILNSAHVDEISACLHSD
jgi:hypothetical protein